MKKWIVATTVAFGLSLAAHANAQIPTKSTTQHGVERGKYFDVHYAEHFKVNRELKTKATEFLNQHCKSAAYGNVTLKNFKAWVESPDQGIRDYYFKLEFEVDYNSNDDDSDFIELVVERFDTTNPAISPWWLNSLNSSLRDCQKK